MKPDKGIARPAKGSGFKPICSIFFLPNFKAEMLQKTTAG